MISLNRRMMFVKILTFIIMMVIIIGLTACFVQASSTSSSLEQSWIDSGKCGKNAVWTYDGNTKILQITGTGVVDQVIEESKKFRSLHGMRQYEVKEIWIGEGITALDAGPLFLNVYPVTKVEIEKDAFHESIVSSPSSDEITLSLPDSLEKIGVLSIEKDRSGLSYS